MANDDSAGDNYFIHERAARIHTGDKQQRYLYLSVAWYSYFTENIWKLKEWTWVSIIRRWHFSGFFFSKLHGVPSHRLIDCLLSKEGRDLWIRFIVLYLSPYFCRVFISTILLSCVSYPYHCRVFILRYEGLTRQVPGWYSRGCI